MEKQKIQLKEEKDKAHKSEEAILAKNSEIEEKDEKIRELLSHKGKQSA